MGYVYFDELLYIRICGFVFDITSALPTTLVPSIIILGNTRLKKNARRLLSFRRGLALGSLPTLRYLCALSLSLRSIYVYIKEPFIIISLILYFIYLLFCKSFRRPLPNYNVSCLVYVFPGRPAPIQVPNANFTDYKGQSVPVQVIIYLYISTCGRA